jgi:hypothetical protein
MLVFFALLHFRFGLQPEKNATSIEARLAQIYSIKMKVRVSVPAKRSFFLPTFVWIHSNRKIRRWLKKGGGKHLAKRVKENKARFAVRTSVWNP